MLIDDKAKTYRAAPLPSSMTCFQYSDLSLSGATIYNWNRLAHFRQTGEGAAVGKTPPFQIQLYQPIQTIEYSITIDMLDLS